MRIRLPIAIGCASIVALTSGAAQADPVNGNTLVNTLFNCSGPPGTPSSFDFVGIFNSETLAFHLVDGAANFRMVFLFDLTTGEGGPISKGNGPDKPLVTCNAVSHHTGDLELVRGFFTPVGGT